MRKTIRHLRLVRTEEHPNSDLDKSGADKQSMECQIEIPGIGRLRTGEYHPNFHGTSNSKKQNRELVKQK